MKKTLADPTPENVHDWRKRAKYGWYHARLLQGANPLRMKVRRTQMKQLADMLGQVHDVDVFRDRMRNDPAPFSDEETRRRLDEMLERERDRLLAEAGPLGNRVFAERPATFAGRIRRYWKKAHRKG